MPKRASDPGETASPYQRAMMNVVASVMQASLADEGRRDRAGKRVSLTLFREVLDSDTWDIPDEQVSEEVRNQWAVLQGYLALTGMLMSLRQTERYFRRYPFRRVDVSRSDHLRNICEMYFDRIAQFRDRLKSTLKAIAKAAPTESIAVGEVIKSFGKAFDWEIRNRNRVHHTGRYDDTVVDQLGLAELVGSSLDPELSYFVDAKRLYRRAAQDWAKRVRGRSEAVSEYLDVVASYILNKCSFVEPHIKKEDMDRIDLALRERSEANVTGLNAV